MNNNVCPKVGVGVVVVKDGAVLLGKRIGSFGNGYYAGPGGHLEMGESFEECAAREVKEETDLEIKNIQFLCVTNLANFFGRHYVDIGLIADWSSGQAITQEPDIFESWSWHSKEILPEPLFGAERNYYNSLRTGQKYFQDF